ncbi:MAG: hypothetical protein RR409_02510 [Clostridium sp.]
MEASLPTGRIFIEIGYLMVFVLVVISLLLVLLLTGRSHGKNV